jgi:predicted metal-dependent phosphoesterase TrpH
MIKLDLHTHSVASPDGGVSEAQYMKALDSGTLDCVAITDHNRIDFAQHMYNTLGKIIIIGEEIMSSQGEIIGLFLTERVAPGLSALGTMQAIRDQGGLVYIPHPFETVRKGLSLQMLEELTDMVDIIEICNGRAFFQNRSQQAVVWSHFNHKAGAASSDAHGLHGLGATYTSVNKLPTAKTLLSELASGVHLTDRPGIRALLYPKYHRTRKKLTLRGKRG